MVRRLVSLAFLLANLGFSGTIPQLPSRIIDLRQWGHPAPSKPTFTRGEIYRRSHLVTVYRNGDVVTGFVTREGATLASRTRLELTLLTLTFDRKGSFLFEMKFPTTMREGNGIFAVAFGNLLVRTPEAVTLWSHERGVISTRPTPGPQTWVNTSPDRETILLVTPGRSLEALSARDLTVLENCACQDQMIGSMSNHNIVIGSPSQYTEPHQRVRVDAICGPTQFEYRWSYPTGTPILLDDRRLIINGHSVIELVDSGTVRWRDSFGKGEYALEVESDEKGDIFAVAVPKDVGGSVLLDINGHLKVMKIVVYRAADGKRLGELVVEHPPRFFPFNFFALSPDGSELAVLSDGFLQIAQLNQ